MLERHNEVSQTARDRIELGIASVVVNLEPFGHFGGLLSQTNVFKAFPWAWNSGKKAKQLQAKYGHRPSRRIRDLVRIGEAVHLFGKLERDTPILETLRHRFTSTRPSPYALSGGLNSARSRAKPSTYRRTSDGVLLSWR